MDEKNYFRENPDEIPSFLQLIVSRIKNQFDLSILAGINSKRLSELYSEEELLEIIELLNTLESKLNDKNGNYRELS